jgi:hypothetical protein
LKQEKRIFSSLPEQRAAPNLQLPRPIEKITMPFDPFQHCITDTVDKVGDERREGLDRLP